MDSLELRKALKRKKPTFMRQDAHKKGKLKNNWRRPKGSDSKMRVRRTGYRRSVKIGWGSPKDIKFAVPDGLMPVLVSNKAQLESIDPKKDCAVMSSGLGLKKKLELLEIAISKDIKVFNVKDPSKYVADAKEKIKAKKAQSEKKKTERSAKKEKAQKEAEKKKKDAEKKEKEAAEKAKAKETKDSKDKKPSPPMTEEEKKKIEEKKEKDKILIQKQ